MFVNDGDLKVAKIRVIGVGGAGNNAVNRMIDKGITSADFYALNTDKQALMLSRVPEENRIQIGQQITKGLGAGSEPELGEQAAEETREEIEAICEGVDLLFIAAGMGGGTGTGAAPVVAKIAKDKGCLTVAVVTKPFAFEGKKREANAVKGIANLSKYVDTIIIIPNDKLLECLPKETPMIDALTFADDNLRQGVCGISDLISTPALINLDFADVRTIIKNQGLAHMGVGRAKGENRIIDAVRQAVSSPLLETTIEGASGVIINITGGKDLSLGQVYEAAKLVQNVVDDSANIIFGANINEDLQEEIIVTLIATGFNKNSGEGKDIKTLAAAAQAAENAKKAETKTDDFRLNGGIKPSPAYDLFVKKNAVNSSNDDRREQENSAPRYNDGQNYGGRTDYSYNDRAAQNGGSAQNAQYGGFAQNQQNNGYSQNAQQGGYAQNSGNGYAQNNGYAQRNEGYADSAAQGGYYREDNNFNGNNAPERPRSFAEVNDDARMNGNGGYEEPRRPARRIEMEADLEEAEPEKKQDKRELPSFVKRLFGKK